MADVEPPVDIKQTTSERVSRRDVVILMLVTVLCTWIADYLSYVSTALQDAAGNTALLLKFGSFLIYNFPSFLWGYYIATIVVKRKTNS